MPNNYCRLSHVKSDQAGTTGTTALDDTYVRQVDQVSREFERECGGRKFYSYTGTRYFAGGTRTGRKLWLPDDLLSVSALVVDDNADDVYELTLAANTDYWLSPADASQRGEPYMALELNPNGTQLYRWPTAPRAVKVTGVWGYSAETEDTGLTGTLSDATDTSLTASATAANLIYPGDTLVIESEQVYVTAVVTTTITVTRGVNGTTAAAHTTKALLVRRYPRDIEMVVAERVVGLRWDAQGGYATGVTLMGDSQEAAGRTTGRGSFARWRDAVKAYRLMVVV